MEQAQFRRLLCCPMKKQWSYSLAPRTCMGHNNTQMYLPMARDSFTVQASMSSCSTNGMQDSSLRSFSDFDKAASASDSLLTYK